MKNPKPFKTVEEQIAISKQVVKQRQLTFAFHVLPPFRNICAHDERLYCARVGRLGDLGLDQLLRALETVTTTERLRPFSKSVLNILDEVVRDDPSIECVILRGMRISREDLEELL